MPGQTWPVSSRHSEIHELDVRVRYLIHHEDVLRLDVAVHDAVHVAVQQRLHERLAQEGAGGLPQRALGGESVKQVATAAQLHDEMHAALVLEGVPERHDAGVGGEQAQAGDLRADVLRIGMRLWTEGEGERGKWKEGEKRVGEGGREGGRD